MKKITGEEMLDFLLLGEGTATRYAATRGVGQAAIIALAEAALTRVRALLKARREWEEN